MELRLRIYEIRRGEMDAWIEEWSREVLPLRRRFGFDVLGAWASDEDDAFTWLLAHDGDYEAADRAYYESDERKAIDPDPARHIAAARQLRVRPIPLD